MSSKMQNVLIKGDRTCSGLEFTFSLRRVVLCARPCTCDAGRASWNSVYDVLLNTVIPCLHFVIYMHHPQSNVGCSCGSMWQDTLFYLCAIQPQHDTSIANSEGLVLHFCSSLTLLCNLSLSHTFTHARPPSHPPSHAYCILRGNAKF